MWYDVDDSPSTTPEDALHRCDTTSPSSSVGPSAISTSIPKSITNHTNSSLPPPNSFDLPQNFYWALPQKIIGMACPNKRKHISNLNTHFGVSVVINLREYATPAQLFTGTNVRNVHFPVKSFGVPTLEQVEVSIRIIEEALYPTSESSSLEIETTSTTTTTNSITTTTSTTSVVEDSKANSANKEAVVSDDNSTNKTTTKTTTTSTTRSAVAINCRGGKGRTGTLICCYLIYKEGITAYEAITRIRKLSPCSVETRGQEEFIEEYYRLRMVALGREEDYCRSLPWNFVPQSTACKVLVVPNPANNGKGNGGNNNNNKPLCRPTYPARDAFMNHPHQRMLIMSRFCELK